MKKFIKYCLSLAILLCFFGQNVCANQKNPKKESEEEKAITIDGVSADYTYVNSAYSDVPAGKTPGEAKRTRYLLNDVIAGTTGFSFDLPNRDYEIAVTFFNPYEKDYAVEIWDERGKQTKAKAVPSGSKMTCQFQVSVINHNLKLFFVLKNDAITPETGEGILFVEKIKINTLPQRTRAQKPALHIVGDSIAHSYVKKTLYPREGWGENIVDYIDHGRVLRQEQKYGDNRLNDYMEYEMSSLTVKNWAHPGDSTASFWRLGKFDNILTSIYPGDCVLIQLGHNDCVKSRPGYYTTPEEYSDNLAMFLQGCRDRGATCILLSPTPRYKFSGKKIRTTAPEYKSAGKVLARRMGVLYLDTGSAVEEYMNTIGKEKAAGYYMIFGPGQYANYPYGQNDSTHFNYKGANKVAHIIATALKENPRVPKTIKRAITAASDYYKGTAVTVKKLTIKKSTVKIKGKKRTGYKLSWKKQKHAKHYNIFKYDERTKSYHKLASTTKTSYVFSKKWENMKVTAVLKR